jgi:hypothetical protein
MTGRPSMPAFPAGARGTAARNPHGPGKHQTGNVPPGQAKKDKGAAPQAAHGNSANASGDNKEKWLGNVPSTSTRRAQ